MTFFSYVAPPRWLVEKVENPFHSMVVVGSMGSGKTTWTLSLIARAVEKLLSDGVDDSEILVVHTQGLSMLQTLALLDSASIDFPKVKYLYWFNDDAPSAAGQHGRRSMSAENVAESQFYVVIRHELERKGFRGFLFVAHATQVYHLIDITFRRTAKVKAFKDYPDEPSDLRIVGPMLGKAYLRKLREITRMVYSAKSYEEMVAGLSTAVLKYVGAKKVVRVEKKEIPKGVAYVSNAARGNAQHSHTAEVPAGKCKAPISKREFRELFRRHGLRGDDRNVDRLYEALMRLFGYLPVEEASSSCVTPSVPSAQSAGHKPRNHVTT